MSDWEYAEAFKELKKDGQKKRASNLANSLNLLTAAGVNFALLSEHHAMVGDYDFWPSNGLFINRKTKARGRGVANLIRKVK